MLLALAATQVYVGFLIANSFYETAIWPAGGALLAVLVMVISNHFASASIKPNLPSSILDDMPNTLDQVDRDQAIRQRIQKIFLAFRNIAPFIPGVVIIAYVLIHQVERWPGLWLIAAAYLSPRFVAPCGRKHLRLTTSSLILIALAFGLHAIRLRRELPPGQWITPITSASCTSSILLDLDRKTAWCADENKGWIYQFMPISGIVGQGLFVDNGSQAFAGNDSRVLIKQNPLRGLVLVENGQQTQIKINLARQGNVDREGRLWVIDVTGMLWISEHDGEWKRLKASDGLLDNTANVVKTSPDGSVWVGSIGGVSRLVAGTTEWQVVLRNDVLPGLVKDFAFTPDGKVWYLWETATAYQDKVRWGVSFWQKFHWSHIELGAKTGLDYPPSHHAVAIDGLGRVWFVAPSYIQKNNYVGILEPSNGVISLYLLGPFDISPGEGFPIPGFNGVIDDGNGGIFLYNPKFSPLRHWRLDKVPEEYQPCIRPCEVADSLDYFDEVLIFESGTPGDIFENHQGDKSRLILSQILEPK
jgi:sugar lactone lactonase YvrE